jgi:hypothetical protein
MSSSIHHGLHTLPELLASLGQSRLREDCHYCTSVIFAISEAAMFRGPHSTAGRRGRGAVADICTTQEDPAA